MASNIRKAQAFAAGFADPLAPTLCYICFAVFAKEIEPDEQIAQLLQTKGHAFWTALMTFVSTDWTAERRESVTTRLRRTSLRCRKCKPAGHRGMLMHAIPDAECFFGIMYQLACGSLHAALRNPMHSYKGLGRKPSRWPTTMEQLFPFGVDRTVTSLVAQLPHRSFTHSLLHNLIAYHRPLVFPVLSEAPNRTLVISTFISRLTLYTSMASAALSRFGPSATPTAQQIVRQEYIKLAQVAILVLFDVVEGSDAQPDDQARFCRGHEVQLFRALHGFITLVGDNEQHHWMAHLASKLWGALSLSQRDDVGHPAPPAYCTNVEAGEALDDPYHALRYFLRNRPRTRTCCSPQCATSVPNASARLLLCAKCRLASYCSQRCQRADWTDALLPHKEVCDALQELQTFTPLDSDEMTSEQFSAACAEHEFPLARVDTLILWATQGRVGTQYSLGGESLNELLKPLDDYEPARPAQGRRVFVKIGDLEEYVVDFPPLQDGNDVTDRTIYKAMLSIRARMQPTGVPVSWRTC
ncbi:hypothetical protein AURDEDRAFT_117364 [Auricularia subglabra TFB-10046 SS5]|uniref:MYND-type domain-containing protein n=1 Tax=Auricularia subglabra (strain TFB-10046 / SS5) TaxID=717982 RepID=J0LEY9_AURST|nr:hypothetical protein AURDEDRAFT_117364 [Auricularia subglabra TFB-10046 SS5]